MLDALNRLGNELGLDPIVIAWLPAALGLLAGLALIGLTALVLRRRSGGAQAQQALETQLAEIKGRLSAMAEMTAQRQVEQARGLDDKLEHVERHLTQTLESFSRRVSDGLGETHRQATDTTARMNERIDALSRHLAQNLDTLTERVGDNLSEASRRTSDTLSNLNERLALIDDARQSLAALSTEVGSLQGVLANKQARGAFGQARMETIIRDALPAGVYEFQATLSNGKRPDCLIRLPNTPAGLVIDSKFPLEGFEALRVARSPDETKAANIAVREAVGRHIDEIADKYLIAGETQDTALMFVPSESVYADLHERFSDLVQKAHRARVVIVAPNILMLAVQTMQAVIKDVKMRDQAGIIQREVGLLLGDVTRLAERITELERHFGLSTKALEKVSASADKITKRGQRLGALDFESEDDSSAPPPARLASRT
jgi:DNA recombination protein RmuC